MNALPAVKDPTVRRVLAFFLLISAVLVVVAAQAVRNINRSVASSDWVNHTHAVILEAEALRAALYVGDAALHAYAQTGDARDLAACRDSLANITDHWEIIQALTRQEPQNEEVSRIGALIKSRAEYCQKIMTAQQGGNSELVRTLLVADGAGASREVQRGIDKLKNEELTLLTERDTASYRQAQTTRWTVWTGVALDVFLLGGVAWLIRDDLAARRRAAVALQEANAQLEARVQARTAELETANGRLAAENLERQWANQALEHQVRYNQLIVDSINDPVLVLTKAMNISRVNSAVVHLTGLELPALINQPLSRVVRLVPPSGSETALTDPIAQALKDGRDLRDQAALVEDKRGRLTPARFTVFPLRDRDKVVGGIVTLQISPSKTESGA
jgi:CHASE3 domain sensor protein